MGMKAKVGSFNSGTGAVSSTVAVSGLGFQPKGIIFWWSGRSESSPTVGRQSHKRGVGFCAGATDRIFLAQQSEDNVGTTNTDRGYRDDGVIGIISTGSVWDGRLDLQSFDSDGFTLVVDVVMGQNMRVHYLALGGTSLTNVTTGTFLMTDAEENLAVTGVGFQPDEVLFFGYGENNVPPDLDTTLRGCTFGGMVDGSQQGYLSNASEDGAGTTRTQAACHMGSECHMRLNVSGAENADLAFVSMDSDGFTVDQVEADDDRVAFMALKGGDYAVVELDSRTDTNDIVVSGLGFQPAAAIHLSAHAAEDDLQEHHQPDSTSIGAWSATDERAVHVVRDEDDVATSDVATATREDAIYARVNGTPAFSARMDLKSIESGGFTCVMDVAEPSTAAHHTVFVFGPRDVATPVSETEATPWESEQTIDQTEVPPWESGQGIDQTNVPAFETVQGIDESEGVAYESLQTITASVGTPWESSQGINQSNVPAVEFLATAEDTNAPPWEAGGSAIQSEGVEWESLQTLAVSSVPPWESGTGISQTEGVAWESLTGISQSNIPPWEAGGTIIQTEGVVWEIIGTVIQSNVPPWESLTGIAQTNLPAWEAGGIVLQTAGVVWTSRGFLSSSLATPWEVVRTPVAANVPPISVEILQGLHPAPAIFWESGGPVSVGTSTPYEWAGPVVQSESTPIEWGGTATQTVGTPWQSIGQASASLPIFWESVGIFITSTTTTPIEILLGLSPASSPFWEAAGEVVSAPPIFWESEGPLIVGLPVNWESLVSLITTNIPPWESLTGVTQPSVPFYEAAGGVFGSLPVIWESEGILIVGSLTPTPIEFLLTVISGALGPSGILMSFDGLTLSEDWPYPNGDVIGTWAEGRAGGGVPGADMSVLSQEVIHANVGFSDRVFKNLPVLPADAIVQVHYKATNVSAAGGVVLRANSPAGGSLGYALIWNESSNQWQIWDEQPSILRASAGDPDRFNAWSIVRAVTKVSGPNLVLNLWGVPAASGTDLTPQPLFKATWTDTTPLPLGYWGVVMGWWGGAVDTLRAYGRLITMTGLPTGWKVQIDSETPVVESGGSVTISAEGLVMPATTIKVLDAGDVEQSSLTPVGGFWGGATFSFAPIGSPIGEVNWESIQGLEPDFTVPIEILGGRAPAVATPWESAGEAESDVSTPWESSGPLTPASTSTPWESLQGGSGQTNSQATFFEAIGFAGADRPTFWESAGEVESPRSHPWESSQPITGVGIPPWEAVQGLITPVGSPWESVQPVTTPGTVAYERLRGLSGAQTAPWASTGRLAVQGPITWESLTEILGSVIPLWESRGRIIPVGGQVWWESRGPVVSTSIANKGVTPYEILQGGAPTTSPVVTPYEFLLGVRQTEIILYEVLPTGVVIGPTITIRRGEIIRPTRAALPFPEALAIDPVTGEPHDPNESIVGPPLPVAAIVQTSWESLPRAIVADAQTFIEWLLTVKQVV